MRDLAEIVPARMAGPYDPSGFYDEALTADGTPRAHYEPLMAALACAQLDELVRTVDGHLAARGVSFRSDEGECTFPVDPIPRIIDAAEWRLLERGVRQRARALNAFATDVYGDQEIVAAGVVPRRVVEGADHFEPAMQGVAGVTAFAPAVGLDIVRGASGELRVLEDNVRTPSGLAYMLAAREATDAALPLAAPSERLDPAPSLAVLGAALRSAAPGGLDDPIVVLLSDGPGNSAWWEHTALAAALDVPIVTPDDVRARDDRLLADLEGEGTVEVDVVYRRTDEDRLLDEAGRPTWVSELLLGPCRAGSIGLVNAFGSGVADDKLVHAYVDAMVPFYLDEQPLLPSVRTYDLGEPEARAAALERLGELVVKPRSGLGGRGIVICPHARPEDVERASRAIREHPEDLVAQDTVWLSRHPTVRDGAIEPRHVDLRLFALVDGDDVEVVPGGLTRVALDEGALVVNSSQNGGGKDTWVLGSDIPG